VEFSWTKQQLALKEDVIHFAQRELGEGFATREARGEFDSAGWRACAVFGIQGLPMPRAYGGRELDMASVVLALEGLGYGCEDNGLLFALGAQLWSVQMPLLRFGSAAQRERFLPGLVSGASVAAHAVTEPDAGSDMSSLQTTARPAGSAYVLTGHKRYITSAPIADLFLVTASLEAGGSGRSLAAFVVERSTPGLTVSPSMDKMGLRTAQMGEVILQECRVPAESLLGKEGAGLAVFASAMEWERAFILAPVLGRLQRQLQRCVEYARRRRQFGRPIGKNQAIATKLVDMHLRLETARLLVYRAAWLKDSGKRLTSQASEVKLHLSEAWVQGALDALQIHGALGYLVESGLEREVRDALASRLFSGTSEIQRVIIAEYLGV
jgi:alkylation response protein AidB-like acyl-CoA dehydrogenase